MLVSVPEDEWTPPRATNYTRRLHDQTPTYRSLGASINSANISDDDESDTVVHRSLLRSLSAVSSAVEPVQEENEADAEEENDDQTPTYRSLGASIGSANISNEDDDGFLDDADYEEWSRRRMHDEEVTSEEESTSTSEDEDEDVAAPGSSASHAAQASSARSDAPHPDAKRTAAKRPRPPEKTNEGALQCFTCVENVADIVFIPCGDVGMCIDCARKHHEEFIAREEKPCCPWCRKNILAYIQIRRRSFGN